jgi:integrase
MQKSGGKKAMRSVSMERLRAEILSLYEPPLRAKKTWYQLAQTFREMESLPGVRKASDLRPPAIAAWIKAYPGRSPARVESLLRCWRLITRYAVDQRWLAISPFATRRLRDWIRPDVVPPKPRPRRSRTKIEIRAFLDLLDRESGASWQSRRLQAFAYFAIYMGWRKEEILHVLAQNVNLSRGLVELQPLPEHCWVPKTVVSARTGVMPAPLVDVLSTWIPMCGSIWLFPGVRLRGPWVGGSAPYAALGAFKGAAARAGIADGMTILGARKSLATNAKLMQLNGLERKELLGHAAESTGEYYDEHEVETMRPAAQKIGLFYGSA